MIKLRDILNEVGEATTTPYKWKKVFTKEDTVFFAFKTDQGTSYKVALENYIYEDFKENDKEYPAIEVVSYPVQNQTWPAQNMLAICL